MLTLKVVGCLQEIHCNPSIFKQNLKRSKIRDKLNYKQSEGGFSVKNKTSIDVFDKSFRILF